MSYPDSKSGPSERVIWDATLEEMLNNPDVLTGSDDLAELEASAQERGDLTVLMLISLLREAMARADRLEREVIELSERVETDQIASSVLDEEQLESLKSLFG